MAAHDDVDMPGKGFCPAGRQHACVLISLCVHVALLMLLCLQHLLPLLDRPDSWDVLIAHYLGVDHAGHTHGVNSRQMQDKLAQMDQQISTVIGESNTLSTQTSYMCRQAGQAVSDNGVRLLTTAAHEQ